jgi:hypothetical protein
MLMLRLSTLQFLGPSLMVKVDSQSRVTPPPKLPLPSVELLSLLILVTSPSSLLTPTIPPAIVLLALLLETLVGILSG